MHIKRDSLGRAEIVGSGEFVGEAPWDEPQIVAGPRTQRFPDIGEAPWEEPQIVAGPRVQRFPDIGSWPMPAFVPLPDPPLSLADVGAFPSTVRRLRRRIRRRTV